MILPSLLAFPLLEGQACWSTCGRRTRPFTERAFREHTTNVGVLPILFIVGALRAQRPYQLSATPVQARLPISPPHSLVDPRMRASNEGLLFSSLRHHTISPKGVARLSFTARIGRAQFHRARSASKKDGLVAPYPLHLAPFARRGTVDRSSLSA